MYINAHSDDTPGIVNTLNSERMVDFYTKKTGAGAEGDRLRLMAEMVNPISSGAIKELLPGEPAPIVIDIGSGASVDLGKTVDRYAQYIPVDGNPEYVQLQSEAGFPAVESYADELAIPSELADVVHARFLMAWLSERQRKKALSEMIRVGRSTTGIVISDYDWSVVDGPQELTKAVEYVIGILETSGFNPSYGQEMRDDVETLLSEQPVSPKSISIDEVRQSALPNTLKAALPFIDATAVSVMEDLRRLNMMDECLQIEKYLEAVRKKAESEPNTPVIMPDIVTLKIRVDKENTELEGRANGARYIGNAGIERATYQEGRDYRQALPGIEGLDTVYRALSKDCIDFTRRKRADAYANSNRPVVSPDAIDLATGMLNSNIEPDTQVERTTYVFSKRNGSIRGGAGLIEPNGAGQGSIPTIARLQDHSPDAFAELREVVKPTDTVCEFTGVYKAPHGKIEDVVGPIIALAEIARREGYDKAVMDLAEFHVRLFESLFGKEAIRQLSSKDGHHPIELEGVLGGVNFIPFVVDIESCVALAYEHARQSSRDGGRPLLDYIAGVTGQIEESYQSKAV